jgi:hypothetical protein
MTLEPPQHRGPFSREQLLGAAARLLDRSCHPENDTAEFGHLKKGRVTLVTGHSNTARSRFVVGLILGMLDFGRASLAPTILYFNRRWTHQEAAKALIQQTTSRMLGSFSTDYRETLIMAIEYIEGSGFIFDNTAGTMNEICRRVSDGAQAPKLIVVDGLEYFRPETHQKRTTPALPEMLDELKTLAEETMLPVIASVPPSTD